LKKQLNETNDKRRIYYYSFQIILGGLIKAVFLISLAILTGSFTETFSLIAFYAGFRTLAGGYHMDDFLNCMLVSLAMFIGLGLIVKYAYFYWTPAALLIFSCSVFAVALFTAIKYAPAETSFKPMNNLKRNIFLKRASIVYLIAWQVLSFFLCYKNLKLLMFAGCLGILLESFSISPAGYKFFDGISNIMKIYKKQKTISR
jgi:Membrane protein putatively involved in post-translational modification of the autoinducing quorum-sensing peptide